MAGSLKPCVFCGDAGKKITRGHIYGQQLLDLLPPPSPGTPFLSKVITLDPLRNEWIEVESRDPRSPRYMPVNVICEECNGPWMGTHETAMVPILTAAQHGATVRFTRTTQWRLSLWICITSILSQYIHKSTISSPASERLFVRNRDEPPDGTYIWLARSGEGPSSLVAMVQALDGRIPEKEDGRAGHRYVYGLVFGPFAAFVMGGLPPSFEPKLNTKPRGAFHRIWPREGSLLWTPKTPRLTAGDLDLFRLRVAAELTPGVSPLLQAQEFLTQRGRPHDGP